MRLKGALSGVTLLSIYSQVQLAVVVFRLDITWGGKKVKTSVARWQYRWRHFNVLCEAGWDHMTLAGGVQKITCIINIYVCTVQIQYFIKKNYK